MDELDIQWGKFDFWRCEDIRAHIARVEFIWKGEERIMQQQFAHLRNEDIKKVDNYNFHKKRITEHIKDNG